MTTVWAYHYIALPGMSFERQDRQHLTAQTSLNINGWPNTVALHPTEVVCLHLFLFARAYMHVEWTRACIMHRLF